MRSNDIGLWGENAAHRARLLAEIGQRLRNEYDTAQPLPSRLDDLMTKIERSTTGGSEGARALTDSSVNHK
jgi:hypothetical protein